MDTQAAVEHRAYNLEAQNDQNYFWWCIPKHILLFTLNTLIRRTISKQITTMYAFGRLYEA